MRIIFFGTPDFAVPSLQRFLDHPDFEVLGVVTQPDKRRGRGNQLIPSPVKAIAETHQLPVWQPARIKKSEETLQQLAASQSDVFVVVAYGQILSQRILDMPRLACVNGHGSILPRYRGAAPIQWCLYHGELETGITTMLMDAGMDTGPMLLKAHTPIDLLENAHSLADRLASMTADLLLETLLKVNQAGIQPIPQDPALATYAPLIQKQDYGLDWTRSGIALHNQVRGFFPNCTTHLQGKELKILATVPLVANYWSTYGSALPTSPATTLDAIVANAIQDQPPGTIVHLAKGLGPVVQTGEGLLLLREVQPTGKRAQSGWDFVNGSRLTIGDRLG